MKKFIFAIIVPILFIAACSSNPVSSSNVFVETGWFNNYVDDSWFLTTNKKIEDDCGISVFYKDDGVWVDVSSIDGGFLSWVLFIDNRVAVHDPYRVFDGKQYKIIILIP